MFSQNQNLLQLNTLLLKVEIFALNNKCNDTVCKENWDGTGQDGMAWRGMAWHGREGANTEII